MNKNGISCSKRGGDPVSFIFDRINIGTGLFLMKII